MSEGPIFKDFVSLGLGKGLSITVWNSHVKIERKERQSDGSWKVTQEIALAPKVLEYLFARIPIWIDKMTGGVQNKRESQLKE